MLSENSMNGSGGVWRSALEQPSLGLDAVHVWRVDLDAHSEDIDQVRAILAEDERQRADRFVFEGDRQHFIVGRGLLRKILGYYLSREPRDLRFRYSARGKPALVGEADRPILFFNLAHSHGLALYALSWNRALGVDVERIRSDMALETVGERFFSPRERAVLGALPSEARAEAFFACWTRKEAYIKARGEGLSLPLDQFDVSVAPGEPAALLATRDDPEEAARWTLCDLEPGPGYAGALAVEGCSWKLWRGHWT
jgi:4'-phosphopantetheinyl transferase